MNINVDSAAETAAKVNEGGSPPVNQKPESEMGSSSSDKGQKKTTPNQASSELSSLRAALNKANASNADLKKRLDKRLHNTPTVSYNRDEISLNYTLTVDGNNYKDSLPIIKGDFALMMAPLLKPWVNVMNAALNANDLRKLTFAYELDENGKPIKDKPLKVGNENVYRTNGVDDLRYYWTKLSEKPAVMSAMIALNKAIKEAGIELCPAQTTMPDHRDPDLSSTAQKHVDKTKPLPESWEISPAMQEIMEIAKNLNEGRKPSNPGDRSPGDD